MKKRVLIPILLVMFCLLGIHAVAAHTHEWEEDMVAYIDADVHKYCYHCCAFNEDTNSQCTARNSVTEKHSLSWNTWDLESQNASGHTLKNSCINCDHPLLKTELHTFDKYGICTVCNFRNVKNSTLVSGKWTYTIGQPWHKIVVPKDGYIKIEGIAQDNAMSFMGYLYNKSKKKYAGVFLSLEKNTYANIVVKKGTYYLRQDIDNGIPYQVRYTFKTIKDQNNYTQKKAVNLKAGKQIEGVVYISAKKQTWTRWYKIKLGSKKRVNLYSYNFEMIAGSEIILPEMYDAKGKAVQINLDTKITGPVVHLTSEKKLKKGTYYIKITKKWNNSEKKNLMGSYYSLKWK